MDQDREQLRLLAILHYVGAGLAAVSGCVPLFQMAFLNVMVDFVPRMEQFGPPGQQTDLGDLPADVVVLMRVLMFIVMGVSCTLAAALILAGRNLQRYRSRTFCMVIAAIECVFFPLGTMLGVFTLTVLTRSSVKALFEGRGTGEEGDRAFGKPQDSGWNDESRRG